MFYKLPLRASCVSGTVLGTEDTKMINADPCSSELGGETDIEVNNCNPRYVCLCLVTQLCPTLCDPMDCSPPGSSVHGDSPGKKTGVGYHALLQGIVPTQGFNPSLPHCRWILYHLSHQ